MESCLVSLLAELGAHSELCEIVFEQCNRLSRRIEAFTFEILNLFSRSDQRCSSRLKRSLELYPIFILIPPRWLLAESPHHEMI